MKLIIDISNDTYESIMARDWENAGYLFSEELKSIHDGIPIPGDTLSVALMFIVEGMKKEIDKIPTSVSTDNNENLRDISEYKKDVLKIIDNELKKYTK